MSKSDPAPRFTPVPRRSKAGWTPAKQRAFIAALGSHGCISAAAASVGMSKAGAYALRGAAGGEGFAAAWDAALDRGIGALRAIAFERAIDGVAVPVFHRGEQVGERRWFDNRLLASLIRSHELREAKRAEAEARRAPADGAAGAEPVQRLEPPRRGDDPADWEQPYVLTGDPAHDGRASLQIAVLGLYRLAQMFRATLARWGTLVEIERGEQIAESMAAEGLITEADLARVRRQAKTDADWQKRAATARAYGLDHVPSGFQHLPRDENGHLFPVRIDQTDGRPGEWDLKRQKSKADFLNRTAEGVRSLADGRGYGAAGAAEAPGSAALDGRAI